MKIRWFIFQVLLQKRFDELRIRVVRFSSNYRDADIFILPTLRNLGPQISCTAQDFEKSNAKSTQPLILFLVETSTIYPSSSQVTISP